MRLRHITTQSALDSIVEEGLRTDAKPSEYGRDPVLDAVYLYHENNIDVPTDAFRAFDEEAVILETEVEKDELLADEDYFRFKLNIITPPKYSQLYQKRAMDSLREFGTVAYPDRIHQTRIEIVSHSF